MLLRDGFIPNFEDTLRSCRVMQQSAHLVPTLNQTELSLAWHYELGLGVPQDRHLAESYFKIAAGRGVERAISYLSNREQEYPKALAAYRARGVGAGLGLIAAAPLAKNDSSAKYETVTTKLPEKSEKSIEDMPRYMSQERGGDFALIVGVEKYGELPPAEYAANDAQAVRRHAIGMGIPERNIIFLENQSASKAQFLAYLDEWLPKNLKDGSRLITYFSGHGSVDPRTGSPYLMPWDGKPAFLRSTAIPVSDVVAKLQNLQGVDSLLILDSCFSGAGGRSVLPKGARPLVVEMPKPSVAGSRVSVLAATSEGEVTVVNDVEKHGAFTFALLREWNRQLGTGKESVSLKTIFKPLSEQVQDFSRRQNIIQTPKLIEATKEFQFGPSAKKGGGVK